MILIFQAGRYVYHPLLPLSSDKNDEPVYADFSVLERADSAVSVRDSMLRLVFKFLVGVLALERFIIGLLLERR